MSRPPTWIALLPGYVAEIQSERPPTAAAVCETQHGLHPTRQERAGVTRMLAACVRRGTLLDVGGRYIAPHVVVGARGRLESRAEALLTAWAKRPTAPR